jgi:ATP-dependent DNA helicase PIF1
VFSNKELDALVAARPQSLGDLRNVPGFGPAKIQKFGDEIIRIVCATPAPASGSSVGAVPEMRSISVKRKLPAAFGGASAQPPTNPLPAPPSVTIPRTALNDEQRLAADRVLGGENCFLTGAAGTGKSFLLRYIIQQLEARHPGGVAVTAPTGIAASHVQGVTIHSWAGFGLGKGTISKLVDKVTSNATACQRWSRAHALLIDEVSMLDSHLFDALDAIGRAVCPDGTHRPFGGLQLILCGDFFQWGLLRLEPMSPRSRPRALGTARSAPLSAPRSRRSLPTSRPCAHRMPTPPAL